LSGAVEIDTEGETVNINCFMKACFKCSSFAKVESFFLIGKRLANICGLNRVDEEEK
jgi:hypothetical protein